MLAIINGLGRQNLVALAVGKTKREQEAISTQVVGASAQLRPHLDVVQEDRAGVIAQVAILSCGV